MRHGERASDDGRVARTRHAIVEAFNRLVLDRSGETIRVADVIDAAGVGRSTFYEHFRNIDDLHTDAALGLLERMADAVRECDDAGGLACVLAHFRENRRIARATLTGAGAGAYSRRLAELVGERLAAERKGADGASLRLAATAAAEAQLALVRVWLEETAPGDAHGFARAVREMSRAAAGALVGDASA